MLPPQNPCIPRLIGCSAHIRHLRYLVRKVAPTPVHVLITGESGAGKNVVAQAIHRKSLRRDRPLVVRNCGALEKNLMRSEFFGHVRGSFTGADESREGLLALAHQGTLFLDEVGELSPEIQGALLRVLENQTYRRVGEKEERHVNIRFIFATNRNLSEEINAGRFSAALYHRLNGFKIEVRPLRERKEDIPVMVDHFLESRCLSEKKYRVSKKAMACMMAYSWPGNIRELQNMIERGIILSENGLLTEENLPREIVDAFYGKASGNGMSSLQEMERQYILRVLATVSGNQTRASKILGIDRKTLYRKLNAMQILEPPGPSCSLL